MAARFWSLKIATLIVLAGIDGGNALQPRQQVLVHGQSLVSDNLRFELGFFNLSSNRYLGIWYKQIAPLTAVWVANRANPLRGNNLKLAMNGNGDLVLRDGRGSVIHFLRSNGTAGNASLALLDSGNLVVRDGGRCLWQSFDFPSDTLLPGMELGLGFKSRLTSWRNPEDPSDGDFVFRLDSPTAPRLLLEKNGAALSRWGPWTGTKFSGSNVKSNPVFRTVYRSSGPEVYFGFEMLDENILLRLVVDRNGAVQFLKWRGSSKAWVPMVTLNKDVCDVYGVCGPYGVCHAADGDPGCRCLGGFRENSPDDWRGLDGLDGCGRRNALNCSDGDGFVKYVGLKMPDNYSVWRGLGSGECGDSCLKECSCMAYASVDVYGNGSECVVWLGQLFDLRSSSPDGDELYIRMARVELDAIAHNELKKKIKNTVILCTLIAAVLAAALWYATDKCEFSSKKENEEDEVWERNPGPEDEQMIQMFAISIISSATNNFSPGNKIGQGGFGHVYQGRFQDEQEIAVKRLSENSNQGLLEFKNEMNLIAQLQHRNLVKLLGCCFEGDERMLVYEYMPNKSLDQFIFNSAKKSLLPWEKRFNILIGIAKGLDYLHFGSRLRVIHRDLKASNILLDEEMNPKISDFGLARNFESEREETTRRVIGTHGYMSPEYVINGHYSIKSDVFSFGVLALEIITGHRNWGFYHPDHDFNLLGHAWKLWNEERGLELIEPVLEESYVEIQVVRCVQIGLLCVQHSSKERPTMSQVVSMLENESVRLAEPEEPGFFTRRSSTAGLVPPAEWNHESVNGLTLTVLTGRD